MTNSFPGDTSVLLPSGKTERIDKVSVGDKVVATDPLTGETGLRKVTAVIKTLTDTDFTDLTVGPPGAGHTLTSTQHHPYWSVTHQRWENAADLHAGERLRTFDGATTQVDVVRNYTGHTVTYNLTVDNLHTYYVLADDIPVLVHNDDANGLGLSREEYIASLIGGEVAKGADGQDIRIHMPNVGSSGLDVRGPNGEYVFVGGAAKANNPSKFGQALKVAKYAADEAGVPAIYYLDEGTPESAIRQAQKVFGAENVHTFSMGC